MCRRAPTPALFPYTTLFRSLDRAAPGTVRIDRYAAAALEGRLVFQEDPPESQSIGGGVLVREDQSGFGARQLLGRATPTDRKSTRLNSSHSSISYAVFCLKK